MVDVTASLGIYDNLDPDQLKAVQYGDGPLLVVSGPGSGKTTVITHRIAYLIQTGRAQPNQILATTFTKKAAQEMRDRLLKLIGKSAESVWMATVHRTCACLLRECGPHLVGLSKNFTVYDSGESLTAMTQVTKKLGLPIDKNGKTKWKAAHIRKAVESAKERGMEPEDFAKFSTNGALVQPYYEGYNSRLRESNAVDFGDLQMLAVRMLRDNPDVLKAIQKRFKYVLVDEYQDTNNVQAEFFKLIAGESTNITVVGDLNQAVYGFRFANPDNIRFFPDEWPGTKVLTMGTNYRSTPNIVRVSAEVISNNPVQYEMDLRAVRPEGSPVLITRCPSDTEAAAYAARLALNYHKQHVPFSEIGVLYRSRRSSHALENAFRTHKIPYEVLGDFPFYERAEVKDLLAYLRLLVNPNDKAAFARVVKTPPRGIGEATVSAIVEYATTQNITLIDAARTIPGLRKKQQEGLAQIITLWDNLSTSQDSPGLVETIVTELAYGDLLLKEDSADDKLGNVLELITSYARFCQQFVKPEGDDVIDDSANQTDTVRFQRMFEFEEAEPVSPPAAFLEYVMLSRSEEKVSDQVQLSTIHSAKGKEYKVVVVVGCEEGQLPHARVDMKSDELEEERRVFYVAATRAKDHLYLLCAHESIVFKDGVMTYAVRPPSRFLNEAMEGGAVET
jgi:DNA helicase-2/ATP-dependent DNA helicase PcrA